MARMRPVLLVVLALASSGCLHALPPSRGHEPRASGAEPTPTCHEVARYELRIVPHEGEWTQPAPVSEGWDRLRVCRADGPSSPAECHVERRADYERARTEQVQIGTERVCERPASTGYAPSSAYVPPSRGGPVHVRGYYRRDGTYVRPHTRRRSR